MARRTKVLIVLIPLLAAGGALAFWHLGHRRTREPYIIRVSGNIEVTDAEVSFKIPGIVRARLVSEGERVEQGQIVALLESADLEQETAARAAELRSALAFLDELEAGYRPEEIAQAQAAADRARAELDKLLAGSRPQEIAAAEAAVTSASAEVVFLELEYRRHRQLLSDHAVSQQDYDRAKADYESARARLREAEEHLKLVREGPRPEDIEQARARLREATEHLALLRKGPRAETIEQSRARVEQSRAALGLAETRRAYATVRSPLSGIVLSDNVEPGEYVAPGTPVITVGELASVWLRAYVNETDLGRVKLGQAARVTTDTYPAKEYPGTLSFIASEAEFTPKNVQTEAERVKLVYRIRIDLPNPDFELKPGMPADADILLAHGGP